MEPDLSQFQWDVVSLRMTAFPAPGSETMGQRLVGIVWLVNRRNIEMSSRARVN